VKARVIAVVDDNNKVGTLAVPTVHLNGSNGETLREAAIEAAYALSRALNALQETYPDGRDYYPQGDGAMKNARDQHEARCEAIAKMRDEMASIAEQIQDQLDRRKEQKR
jgi:phage-related tail protein